MVSVPLFTMSNIALFHVNFNFINRVLWVPPSNTLTIAIPDILSMNGAFTFISFCLLGFKNAQFSGNMGTDLLKNLKQQSLAFITPLTQTHSLCLKLNQHFCESWIPMCKFQIYAHVHL